MPSVTALFNEQSLQAQLAARRNTAKAGVAMNQAATGLRTALAKYDSSAFAVSKTLTALTGVLAQADRNTSALSSAVGIALGAASEVADLIASMATLATRANNGTLDTDTQAMIQSEFEAMQNQVADIYSFTRFNGSVLFNAVSSVQSGADAADFDASTLRGITGSDAPGTAYTFTITQTTGLVTVAGGDSADWYGVATATTGAQDIAIHNGEGDIMLVLHANAGFDITSGNAVVIETVTNTSKNISAQVAEEGTDTVTATITARSAATLGIDTATIDVTTAGNAATALGALKDALTDVNGDIADLAALQRRLEAQSSNLQVALINTEAARSSVADADMSSVIGEYVRYNTAAQIASAMAPKANALHQMFLDQVLATR